MSVVDMRAVSAADSGRICAIAGRAQRDMRAWADEYPRLYGAKAFDPALFSTLALAAAFSGPWFESDQLRMANRACLWCFGLDWLIDYAASSRGEVCDLVRRCLAVADGADPSAGRASDDAAGELLRFLAAIRDELSTAPRFPALRHVWRDELERMLIAMAREWDWKTALAIRAVDGTVQGVSVGAPGGAADGKLGEESDGTADEEAAGEVDRAADEVAGGPTVGATGQRADEAAVRDAVWDSAGGVGVPTFADYLDNADNLGFSFVLATQWISVAHMVPQAAAGTAQDASTDASGNAAGQADTGDMGDMEGIGADGAYRAGGRDGTGGTEGTGAAGTDAADIAVVRAASHQAQRVIRLLNDLGTYERDLAWGDLNALSLGVTREDVERVIGVLTADLRELLGPVRAVHPWLADYMERQVEFCAGFYGVADYWGEL